MKQKSIVLLTDEKTVKKRMFWILGFCMALMFTECLTIQVNTIGGDKGKYNLYLLLPALTIGSVCAVIYWRSFLKSAIKDLRANFFESINAIIPLLVSLAFSVGFFFLVVELGFEIAMNSAVKQKMTKTIYCPINRVTTSRRYGTDMIHFTYQNKEEGLYITPETAALCRSKPLGNFQLRIETLDGFWDYKVAERWRVIPK